MKPWQRIQTKRHLKEKLAEAQHDAKLNEMFAEELTREKGQLSKMVDELSKEKGELSTTVDELQQQNLNLLYLRDLQENDNQVLHSVLKELLLPLRTPEELKRAYEAVAPDLDEDGFHLYFAAKALTKIDVSKEFPYEDNLGYFSEMDGYGLMEYLVALRFNAVEWKIAGNSYEKAILQPVDTTTPEYLAFEGQLYTAALEKLGLRDRETAIEHLEPRQTEDLQEHGRGSDPELEILKLYSPLTAELEIKPDHEDYYGEPDMEQLTGAELVYYQDAILEGIADETLPEETARGLMTYFSGSPEVDRKVQSLRVTVENHNGTLYGVAVCELKEPLRPNELEELKSAAIGQYADGWGEGFEQRPRSTGDGDLYVHFWQPENFYIRTAQEMEQEHLKNLKNRGGDAR